MKIILEGIVGSVAYGLDNSESDIDIKGVFIYPTRDILLLHNQPQTINQTSPDIEYHEIKKFMLLAGKCNPTILELLFLNEYTQLTPEGKLLVKHRDFFLSKQVLKTYGGYALNQAKKLYKKGVKFARYKKHARHCFRLLIQGEELLQNQTLTVKLSLENKYKLLPISELSSDELINRFEEEFKIFNSIKTELPENPDWKNLDKILLKIREMNYDR